MEIGWSPALRHRRCAIWCVLAMRSKGSYQTRRRGNRQTESANMANAVLPAH